jgi:hypothetical protein
MAIPMDHWNRQVTFSVGPKHRHLHIMYEVLFVRQQEQTWRERGISGKCNVDRICTYVIIYSQNIIIMTRGNVVG